MRAITRTCIFVGLLGGCLGGEDDYGDELGTDEEAARGGRRNTSPPPSTATVSIISANPVPVGTAPTFHGTGYAPGQLVFTTMTGFMVGGYAYADPTGSFTYTWYQPLYNPGTYTFTTGALGAVNLASVTFTAQ